MRKGFIVHPFETMDNKFHASYGNHNKTAKSFKTLTDAKKYLGSKGLNRALYDSPSGARNVIIGNTKRRK